MTAKKNIPVLPTPAERLGFHYYGSTCFSWRCANTRQEVLTLLARDAGATEIRRNLKGTVPGVSAVTCRVKAPLAAAYKISGFLPVGVETVEIQQHAIVSVKGATIQLEPDFYEELEALPKEPASPLSEQKA